MTRIILSMCCLSVLFFALADVDAGKIKDKDVIAEVNGYKIMKSDVEKRLKTFDDTNQKTYNALKREVINQLITDVLLEKFIDKQGIVVTSLEVERELNQIKYDIADNKRDADKFLKQMLDSIGSNLYDFKRSIRHSIALEKYFDDRLNENNLKEFFEKEKSLFNGESVKISHIYIDKKNSKTDKEASKALDLIQKIKREIEEGADFEELAKKYSDSPSANNGGNLGYVQRNNTFERKFLDAAFSLSTGEISDPVKTDYGYHLIKVIDKKEGEEVNFRDVKAQVRVSMLDREILNLIDQLRQRAIIVIDQ